MLDIFSCKALLFLKWIPWYNVSLSQRIRFCIQKWIMHLDNEWQPSACAIAKINKNYIPTPASLYEIIGFWKPRLITGKCSLSDITLRNDYRPNRSLEYLRVASASHLYHFIFSLNLHNTTMLNPGPFTNLIAFWLPHKTNISFLLGYVGRDVLKC